MTDIGKGKVTDKDLMDFYNEQSGAKPPRSKSHPPIIFAKPANFKLNPDDVL